MRRLITLTTDFGLDDPFAGIMKGVILSICPDVAVVDLTHAVAPQDVVGAAWVLEASRPYFPEGTIHLAVVDPGVGTRRHAVAVFTGRDVFVAPDNGVPSFLWEEEIREARAIQNPAVLLHPVSRTFHGRDVFAPAAARLATGLSSDQLGPALGKIKRIQMPRAKRTRNGVQGAIVSFDRFGNAVTAIRSSDLPTGALEIRLGETLLPWVETYGVAPHDVAFALLGSSDRLEVSVREASAREFLGLRKGDLVSVTRKVG